MDPPFSQNGAIAHRGWQGDMDHTTPRKFVAMGKGEQQTSQYRQCNFFPLLRGLASPEMSYNSAAYAFLTYWPHHLQQPPTLPPKLP